MKKLLALCAGMMLIASAAMAQGALHMTWNSCPNTAGAAPSIAFSCDPINGGEIYNLIGTFTVAASTPGVVAMDGIIDWLFPNSPDVPAFWQFQGGGCNETGLVLIDGRPGTICATNNSITLCSSGGGGCDGVITAYGLGSNVPALGALNRARLLITLARASTSPVTLAANVAPAQHFAFQFQFFQDNAVGGGAGECAGCNEPAAATWNQAIFYNTSALAGEEGIAVNLSSASPGSDANVGANGAAVTVSTTKKSWGSLKSLYR
jgi:hypothetical protein